jgi:putative membrane protein
MRIRLSILAALLGTIVTGATASAQSAGVRMPDAAAIEPAGFVKDASQDGRAEVALAELASQKASNADVKAFAAHLSTDHKKANADLTTIAQAQHLTVPTAVASTAKETQTRLSKLSGAAFDRAYIDEMVSAHRKAITLFDRAAKNNKNADIKKFAAATLPTLQSHLDQALSLQKQLAK